MLKSGGVSGGLSPPEVGEALKPDFPFPSRVFAFARLGKGVFVGGFAGWGEMRRTYSETRFGSDALAYRAFR